MTEANRRSPLLPHTPQPWRELIILCGIALAYALVARLGLLLVSEEEGIAALWPVSGFALSVVLLRDRRRWPGTLAAMFTANALANLSGGNSLLVSLGFAVANTLEPLLGAWVLRTYYPRTLNFKHPADVVALTFTAIFSAGVAGLLGAAVPALAFGAPYFATWLLWLVADGMGILLVTPVIMTWATQPDRTGLTPRRLLEAASLTVLLTGSTWFVFGPLTIAEEAIIRPYLIYPFLVWAALRFSPRGTSSMLLLASTIAAFNTALDMGAFAFPLQTHTQHILTLQLYLGVTTVTILILSAIVTERQRVLKALQGKTDELDSFFSVNPDLLCIADTQGIFRRLNPEWEVVLGYALRELTGQNFFDFVHPDDQASTRAVMANLSAQQPVRDFVNRYRCRDGSWRWLEWRAVPIGDLIYAAARDITVRQETERKLRESEANLKRSQEVAHVGHWMWNTRTNHLSWSDEMYRIFGVDPAAFTGDLAQVVATAIHPDDRDKVEQSNAAVIAEQRPAPMEYRVIWPDHSVHTVWAEPSDAFKDDTGQIVELMGIVQDITARKQAEEKVRQSEERYRRLVDGLPSVVYIQSSQRGGIYYSPSVTRMLGHSLEYLYANPHYWNEAIHPDDRGLLAEALARSAAGALFDVEYRIRDAYGDWHWLLDRSTGYRVEDGEIFIEGLATDITERKQMEEALRASEEQYRHLIQFLPAGVIVHQSGWVVLANRASARVFGADAPEQLVGVALMSLVHPDDRAGVRARVGKALQYGDVADLIEEKLLRLDGATIYAEVTALPVMFGGQPSMLAVFNDVTERREAQEQRELALVALRDSERRLKKAQEIAHVGDWELDLESKAIYASEEAFRIYGIERTSPQLPLDLVQGCVVPDDRPRLDAALQRVLTQTGVYNVEFCIHRVDNGELRYIHSRAELMLDQAGQPVRLLGTIQDVSASRAAEAALRDSEARYRALFEAAPIAIWEEDFSAVQARFAQLRQSGVADLGAYLDDHPAEVAGLAGQVEMIEVNQASVKLLGGEIKEQIVTALPAYFTAESLQVFARELKALAAGQTRFASEIPVLNIWGEPLWLDLSLTVRPGYEATLARVLVVFSDITARKQAEAQRALALEALRESEGRYRLLAESLEQQVEARTSELATANARLTELDQLKSKFVSDVSHELRTPIANVRLYIDLLTHGRPEKHTQYITVLEQQIRRVAALVDDILDLSRLEQRKAQGGVHQAVALNDVVDQVVTALQPRADADGLMLRFEPDSALPPIQGDANQLAQVATNLAANALNYTPAGWVMVRTYRQDAEVCLSVADSGLGIDEIDLPHLFERFYRGHHVPKNEIPGTGLGLPIVKEIVELHRGRIEIDSQPGQGSTFRVWLPIR